MREVYEIDISPGCYYIHIVDKPGKGKPTWTYDHEGYQRGDEAYIEAMSQPPVLFEEGFVVNKTNPTVFMPVLHNGFAGDIIKYKLVGTLIDDVVFNMLKQHLEKYGSESNVPCDIAINLNSYEDVQISDIIDFNADPKEKFKPFEPTVTGESELEIQERRRMLDEERERRHKMLQEIYDIKNKPNVLSRGLSSVKSILSAMPDSQGKSKLLQWLENNNKRINRATFERLTDNGVLTIICDILNNKNLS